MIGRGRELGAIAEALADPDLHGVVLVGSRGLGKTRLANECLRIGADAGYATARAVATRSAAELPLGALAPLLPDLGGASADLLGIARRALADRADGARLLLLVDDGHLLDETSATLLLQLAADGAAFLVVTIRKGEPVHDAVTALWKDGMAVRLDIEELEGDEMEALAVAMLGDEVDDAVVHRLRELSSGNPLAMRELVFGAVEAGALTNDDGRWSAPGGLAVSNRLSELVAERIGTLPAGEREALELVVLGEPLDLDYVGALVAEADLAALEQKRLIEVRNLEGRVEVWLSHPLHGEVVRSQLQVLRRRSLLRRLLDAVDGHGRKRTGDLMRTAMWRLELGDRSDPDLLYRAAHQAYVALDAARAAELAEAAWTAGGAVAAAHLAGHARVQLGDHAAAEVLLASAQASLDADPGGATDELRTQVAMARSENLFRSDAVDDAIAVLEAAEAAIADEDWQAELIGHRATLVMLGGDSKGSLTIVAPLLDHPSPRPSVEAAIAGGTVLAYDGRALDAIDLARRAFVTHSGIWEQELFQSDPGVHVFTELLALTHAGLLIDAEGLAGAAYGVALASQSHQGIVALALQHGLIALERGHPRTAMQWFERTTALYQRHGPRQRRRFSDAGRLLAAGVLGDAAAAARAEADLDAEVGSVLRFSEPSELVARSWHRTMEGRSPEAQELLEQGFVLGTERGVRSAALQVLHAMARQGREARAVELLDQLEPQQGPLPAARVDHIRALAARDAVLLGATGEAFEAIGADLYAAEAHADAARAHGAAGAARDARMAANRSRAAVARCEGAATPALALGDGGAALTKREREVALLAARGLAAKDIAERLFLSHRTVENHLQHVYDKTGATGRASLVEALGVIDPGGVE
jgi:DNA-binding CsgD family transcriptional regulator